MIICQNVILGEQVYLFSNATNDSIILEPIIVGPFCQIKEYVFLGPGTVLRGCVEILGPVFITGKTLSESDVKIGRRTIIQTLFRIASGSEIAQDVTIGTVVNVGTGD